MQSGADDVIGVENQAAEFFAVGIAAAGASLVEGTRWSQVSSQRREEATASR